MTAAHIDEIFLDAWVMPYGVPDQLLTDNGPQLAGKNFKTICVTLGTVLLKATAYNLKTNGQTKQYINTITNILRHYLDEHQDD